MHLLRLLSLKVNHCLQKVLHLQTIYVELHPSIGCDLAFYGVVEEAVENG